MNENKIIHSIKAVYLRLQFQKTKADMILWGIFMTKVILTFPRRNNAYILV